MKDLLGGKGAGLAEMSRIGLNVPAGFTISTEVCEMYGKTTSTDQAAAAGTAAETKGGGGGGVSTADQVMAPVWEEVDKGIQFIEQTMRAKLRRRRRLSVKEGNNRSSRRLRRRDAPPCVRALGSCGVDAGHDGHGAEPGDERRGAGRHGQGATPREHQVRLRRLPPPAGYGKGSWWSEGSQKGGLGWLVGLRGRAGGGEIEGSRRGFITFITWCTPPPLLAHLHDPRFIMRITTPKTTIDIDAPVSSPPPTLEASISIL